MDNFCSEKSKIIVFFTSGEITHLIKKLFKEKKYRERAIIKKSRLKKQ